MIPNQLKRKIELKHFSALLVSKFGNKTTVRRREKRRREKKVCDHVQMHTSHKKLPKHYTMSSPCLAISFIKAGKTMDIKSFAFIWYQ